MRLSEREVGQVLDRLEERRYGRRLDSMELAQKAGVSLDYVNQVENRLSVTDGGAEEKIAKALSISVDLLRRVSGREEFSDEEWSEFQRCLVEDSSGRPSAACERLGFRRFPWVE